MNLKMQVFGNAISVNVKLNHCNYYKEYHFK